MTQSLLRLPAHRRNVRSVDVTPPPDKLPASENKKNALTRNKYKQQDSLSDLSAFPFQGLGKRMCSSMHFLQLTSDSCRLCREPKSKDHVKIMMVVGKYPMYHNVCKVLFFA